MSLRAQASGHHAFRRRYAGQPHAGDLAIHLSVQYEVSQILAQAGSIGSALPRLLRAVCRSYAWDVGELWLAAPSGATLQRQCAWSRRDPSLREFASDQLLGRLSSGECLVGAAFVRGETTWLRDLPDAAASPRSDAFREAGLEEGLATPVWQRRGVLCLLRRSPVEAPPPPAFIEAIEAVSRQVATFLHRRQTFAETLTKASAGVPDSPENAIDHVQFVEQVSKLLARLKAGHAEPEQAGQTIGDVVVDAANHGLQGPSGFVPLSRLEWRLLMLLLASRGHVVEHETLLESAWGKQYSLDRRLLHDSVCRLRQRLRDAGLPGEAIHVAHGVGYRLD